jgi:hypothetical protein
MVQILTVILHAPSITAATLHVAVAAVEAAAAEAVVVVEAAAEVPL